MNIRTKNKSNSNSNSENVPIIGLLPIGSLGRRLDAEEARGGEGTARLGPDEDGRPVGRGGGMLEQGVVRGGITPCADRAV